MKQPSERMSKTSGLKILIFWLHYITKYFADIKFPNKESMTTETFAFSRFKK